MSRQASRRLRCFVAAACLPIVAHGVPAASAPAPFGQNPADYQLAFAEEFNGSGLDPQKWNDHIWYLPRSSSPDCAVEDGKLKIWPQRNAAGKFVERILTTDGKYYQTYGYFEMEAKLPRGRGPWPAFWLINHDDETPPNPLRPEIDIMEAYPGDGSGYWSGKDLRPTAYSATVFPWGAQGQMGTKGPAGQGVIRPGVDLSAGFHKYALRWEPGLLTFFFDGRKVYSLKVEMGKPNRMFILVNLQYGSASRDPDSSTPTGRGNAFEVNYIRSWHIRGVAGRSEWVEPRLGRGMADACDARGQ